MTADERTITQIAVAKADVQTPTTVIALCSDGTLWVGKYDRTGNFKWERLPAVPNGGNP